MKTLQSILRLLAPYKKHLPLKYYSDINIISAAENETSLRTRVSGEKNPRAEIEMRYQAGRRTFKIGEDVSTTKYYN